MKHGSPQADSNTGVVARATSSFESQCVACHCSFGTRGSVIHASEFHANVKHQNDLHVDYVTLTVGCMCNLNVDSTYATEATEQSLHT